MPCIKCKVIIQHGKFPNEWTVEGPETRTGQRTCMQLLLGEKGEVRKAHRDMEFTLGLKD